MTDLARMRLVMLDLLDTFGAAGTLQKVAAVYDPSSETITAGTVTETVTSYPITCSDIINESVRLGPLQTDTRATGMFLVAASGLAVTPTINDRIVYQTRNFQITNVIIYRMQAGVVGYAVDVSEIGAP